MGVSPPAHLILLNSVQISQFRNAAEQRYAKAQYNLGVMYANGAGVLEDYVQAYAWWSIAATRGDKDAKKNKGMVQNVMTPAQIAEGHRDTGDRTEDHGP